MEADETFAMAAIRDALSGVLGPVASRLGGRLFKSVGDGVLIEFASPVSAVQTAMEVQTVLDRRAAEHPQERRIVLRIGINLGDVVVKPDGDLYGDGVNVAARIEGLSPPGGVSMSAKVREELHGKIDVDFADGGEHELKGISRPVRIFTWSPQGGQVAQQAPGRTAVVRPLLALPDKPSIAVLPFANMSGDPEQEYFADGIAEDIITALSRVQAFFVIARNSCFSYKRSPASTLQVGRELGVRYVLEGSVRKAGERLRITGQLVEAETGRHVWAERFDGMVADVFELQDKVTSAIAGAMEPNLRVAELVRVRAKPTTDFTAYDLYLNALFLLSGVSWSNHVQAQGLLHKALDLDPDYAEAMAVLSLSLGQSVLQGWSDEQWAAALDLSRRAAQIAPHNPGVLAIAAASEALHDGSYDRSDQYAAEALRLAPDSAQVQLHCASAFAYGGRSDDAIRYFETALRLSPFDLQLDTIYHGLSAAHFFAGRYDDCARYCRLILTQHPDHVATRRYLAAALGLSGKIADARDVIADLRRLAPSSCIALSATSNFRHAWQLDVYLDGLRRAGLPEKA